MNRIAILEGYRGVPSRRSKRQYGAKVRIGTKKHTTRRTIIDRLLKNVPTNEPGEDEEYLPAPRSEAKKTVHRRKSRAKSSAPHKYGPHKDSPSGTVITAAKADQYDRCIQRCQVTCVKKAKKKRAKCPSRLIYCVKKYKGAKNHRAKVQKCMGKRFKYKKRK